MGTLLLVRMRLLRHWLLLDGPEREDRFHDRGLDHRIRNRAAGPISCLGITVLTFFLGHKSLLKVKGGQCYLVKDCCTAQVRLL